MCKVAAFVVNQLPQIQQKVWVIIAGNTHTHTLTHSHTHTHFEMEEGTKTRFLYHLTETEKASPSYLLPVFHIAA